MRYHKYVTMKRYIILGILLGIFINYAQPQELYYLEEGFEEFESTSQWINEPLIPNKVWEFTYGGQYLLGGNPYNPELPYQGDYNAGIYFPSLDLDTVKLVSPYLELQGSGKPTLRFFHCQYEKAFKGPDYLGLYFRSSPEEEWDLIDQWTTNVDYWKDEIYDIADIDSKYLTDSFQLAFEGIIGNGYGVYVDSVTVREDTIVQKFVKSTAFSSLRYDAISSGATDVPLQKIMIRVLGNTGSLLLDSMTFIPTGSGTNYMVADSFKLFCTNNSEEFAPYKSDTSTLIAMGSLASGKICFKNISHPLLLNDNYFWLAASFNNTLTGQASVRFSIPQNGISVSDTTFPATQYQFSQYHLIRESVYYTNFESGATGWTLEGNFETGWPEGNLIGSQSNPESPFNGTGILATDLNGGYYPNIDSTTAYYAYTPELDLTYYIDLALNFQSQSIFNGYDHASIEYSINGGSSWSSLWTSDPGDNDFSWTEFHNENLSDIAKHQPRFQLRFGIVDTKTTPWPGFSIDNFSVLGDQLFTDVGVTEILHPFDGCRNCGNDTVKVWFKNFAINPAPAEIPVYFGLWGTDSILVYDTLTGGIPVGDSILFIFSQLADFPIGDYYDDFVVGLSLAGDQDQSNNTLNKPIIIQNNYSPPLFEDFEYKGGIWLPGDNSTWSNVDLSGTIPTDPESPHIWVLSAGGNYRTNDTSWVTSGCFDLSDDIRNIIQFKYWSNCESLKDGARFEYTTDEGNTWKILEDTIHNIAWNWIVDTVEALNSRGWSGINEWTDAKAVLPVEVDFLEKAKFRMMFMSDGSTSYTQGFAFNDLSIYPAPPDMGVSSITIPENSCQGVYSNEMSLWVKNYGFNDLHTEDTVIIGYDFESEPAVIDTFYLGSDLEPGDSTFFIVPTYFDIDMPGTYNITAYTLGEDDPWFYGINNDTTIKPFEIWPQPITGLDDTISSRQPDTLFIEPIYDPDYDYLWGDMSTNPTYDVEVPGTVYLTVTESTHGCQTYDSVFIELLFNDVGIDSIIWPQSACELSSSETVQVQVRNFGTDSLVIDDKILLYYSFNGGPLVADSITLTAPLYSGSVLWFSFDDTSEDLSAVGDYTIEAFTDYGGDTIAHNDTIFRTISVHGYPQLELGNDTIIEALTYLLEVAPDPRYDTYLWNDGVTTGTRIIDTSGVYHLDITDIYGCPVSDEIDIWFRIRDISPTGLVSPVSSCERFGSDPVILRIENTGSDTITGANPITVSYRLDEEAVVSDIITVSELLPGAHYDHTFTGDVTLLDYGTYDFELTAVTANDLRTFNDTLLSVVSTNVRPEVDLGVDPDEIYYVTQMVLDAGYGENYVYLWQDESTNRTYTVTDITEVAVLVTDTVTGCYGGDTVLVYLDILDYMISNISLGTTTCSGTYDDVEVTLLNNGNLPRQGAEITLEYSMGGSLLFTDYFTNIGSWAAGATRIHITQNPIDLEDAGTEQLEISISTTGDIRPENDDFSRIIEVIPSPDVDLGPPTLEVDFPYTLDAGSGYASYEWSDGSSNSTFTATEDGTYSVTVTGTNGCVTVESIYLADVLGINSVTAGSIDVDIFPNPTDNLITVEAVFSEPGTHIIEVYNSQNILFIMRETDATEYREEFDVGNLPPGIYFIRIRGVESYRVSKLIIQ